MNTAAKLNPEAPDAVRLSRVTAVDIHRSVWGFVHGQRSHKDGRNFLFDFRVSPDQILISTRDMDQPSPLRFGATYRFAIRLTPVRRRATGNGKVKERAVPRSEAQDWAIDLLARNGLRVDQVRQTLWESFLLGKKVSHKYRPHVLHTLLMSIDATVIDQELADRAWGRGIGRGRAWGCGTLTLKS